MKTKINSMVWKSAAVAADAEDAAARLMRLLFGAYGSERLSGKSLSEAQADANKLFKLAEKMKASVEAIKAETRIQRSR